MLGALLIKECTQLCKSITYIIFVAVLILFGYTQIGSEFDKLEKPEKGLESYGVKYEEIPGIIMPNAAGSLYNEFVNNSYVAYPVGFYRNVKLGTAKQVKIAKIISELTGIPYEAIMKAANIENVGMSFSKDDMVRDENGNFKVAIPDNKSEVTANSKLDITVEKSLGYETFLKLMTRADKIIGGGSKYNEIYLKRFGEVPKTYEDALMEYNDIVYKDKITGALARVFCDYFGIILAILPTFIAVAAGMKDHRAKMQELIFSRRAASYMIIFTRFSAMIVMTFLPVIILSLYATFITAGDYNGSGLDMLAFLKYAFSWLLPTILVSTAVGGFLTELTETPVAIAVQGLWWFIGLFAGIKNIDGGYGASLVIRHNEIGNTQVYLDNIGILLINRVCYTLFALLLVSITIIVYEQKRKGRINVFAGCKKVLLYRFSKSKA
jgi:hypothetical protein